MNNDDASPYFSIVIPVYNRATLLQDTVKSVLEQTFTSFEIIIVDDGSTDGSGAAIDTLYGNKSNITIIHQQNQERGASRNNGFKKAKGEYVIFLDSDDRLMPVHLDVLYNKIKTLNNPDFISTKYDFLRNGKRVRTTISDLNEGYYDYRLFLNGNYFSCNVCVRRLNEKLCLFEEDRRFAIKEDWLFFLQNLQTQKIYLVDQVTLLMVDHDDRSMRQNDKVLVEKTFLSREWILKHVKLSEAETRQLDAHVNYFCAIHSYLDFQRITAFNFLKRAFYNGGLKKKYIVLLAKIIIGRKLILKLNP
jgi:glycosyltransferase involved in cell wall biosynthesis